MFGTGVSSVWKRSIWCLVSEYLVFGIGVSGVWYRSIWCLVSEYLVFGIGVSGVWYRISGVWYRSIWSSYRIVWYLVSKCEYNDKELCLHSVLCTSVCPYMCLRVSVCQGAGFCKCTTLICPSTVCYLSETSVVCDYPRI